MSAKTIPLNGSHCFIGFYFHFLLICNGILQKKRLANPARPPPLPASTGGIYTGFSCQPRIQEHLNYMNMVLSSTYGL